MLRWVRQGELWCAFLALAVGLSVASVLEPMGTDAAPLTSFDDRAISPAVIDGIDATSVGRSYGRFYLLLGLSFFALLVVLGRLNGAIRARLPRSAVAREQRGVLLLSEFSLALFALEVIAATPQLETVRSSLHLVIGLIVSVMIGKAVVASLGRGGATKLIVASLLDDSELLIAALFMPVPILFVSMLAAGTTFTLPGASMWSRFSLYGLSLLLLAVVYVGVVRRLLDNPGAGMSLSLFRLNGALIVAGIPLSAIPLSIPIANELQHRWTALSPRLVAGLLVVALVAVAAILFHLQAKRRINLSGPKALAGFYFPILVLTLATFSTHQQTVVLGTVDLLETGEQVVPAQQLLRFGKVPFLDLLPPGGLTDLTSQVLYSVVNGYQGLDMVAWSRWVAASGVFLLIYAFLAVTTSPVIAVLATALMPVTAVFGAPYAVALVPAVALVAAIRYPGFWSFLALWATTGILVFWSWQAGSIAALTLLIVVALVLLERRELRSPTIRSLLTALLMLPVILIVTDTLWVGSTLGAIQALVATHSPEITAGSPTSSAPNMAMTLRYFLLPTVAMVVLLYYGVRRLIGPGRIRPRTYAVVFASVFSLVVAASAALWPSTGPWFDPVLFLLVLAVVPYCWDSAVTPRRMVRPSVAWMLAILVLSVPVGKASWGHLSESFDDLSLAARARPFDFHRWRSEESRVLYDESVALPIASFLESELAEDETFFDFTDAPLLYMFTDREFPTQLLTNRSRTSETIQSAVVHDLNVVRDEGRLPLVLFRTRPSESNGSSDLPNEVRSYRIAEFVYEHYAPWLEIDGYEIWRQRGIELGSRRTTQGVGPNLSATLSQDFWLGRLPYIWARFDPQRAVETTEVLSSLHGRITKLDSRNPLGLPVDLITDRSAGNYLQIRARPVDGAIGPAGRGEGPVISIEYGRPVASSFHLEVVPKQSPPWDESAAVTLDLMPSPKLRQLKRLKREDRLVVRAKGRDPHLFSFVDVEGTPRKTPGTELWLRLRYRSSSDQPMQIFFANDKSGFSEHRSIRTVTSQTGLEGEPAEVVVPVLANQKTFGLTDLRVDPPDGSDYEIVSVELAVREPVFDDYLVRLSSQWRWASTSIDKLVLKASGPVLVGDVLLRRGD